MFSIRFTEQISDHIISIQEKIDKMSYLTLIPPVENMRESIEQRVSDVLLGVIRPGGLDEMHGTDSQPPRASPSQSAETMAIPCFM